MPLLQLAQEQNSNWLPLSAMNKIAELLDMPAIRVYEVATFYSMYNREPVGKYHIQLCGTTPCQLCGAEKIKSAIEKHLGIHEGETSKDGLFTLSEVECLGACVNAPMIQVNNHEFYENLTEESTIKLLDGWRAGRPPKVGPQNNQSNCEGPQGKTSLKTVPAAICRDLDQIKADLNKPKEAAPGAAPVTPNAAKPTPAAPAPPKKN
jgi:NADH dehydrogenase (ubiquinone) flavoprotein 2